MVWRQGASQDSFEHQHDDPAMPWHRGAETVPREDAREVVVEKWDHELERPTRADEAAAAARRVRANIGPGTRHVVDLLLFAGAVVGALAGLGVAWMHIVGDPLADARAYYDAAARLNAGQPLYPAGIDPSSNRIYLYPPLLAFVLRPLALLPYEAFALVWELVVIGAFVALVRYLGVRRRSTWIAIGLLGVPIGWCLTIAQAHIPMTYLMALGQPWSIAVAANIKLFPALIALWWLGRRDWQSFMAFLVWSALLVLAQLLVAFDDSLAYFLSVGFDQLGEVRNISPFVVSPYAWVALLMVGGLVVLLLARSRFGWAAAVTFGTLAPPRLLVYMLAGLLAAVRTPRAGRAGEHDT